MACNCNKKINEVLKKEFNDPSVYVDELFVNGAFRFAIAAHYHKKKKNGDFRKGISNTYLLPKYCPFCGKPYFEDDKR